MTSFNKSPQIKALVCKHTFVASPPTVKATLVPEGALQWSYSSGDYSSWSRDLTSRNGSFQLSQCILAIVLPTLLLNICRHRKSDATTFLERMQEEPTLCFAEGAGSENLVNKSVREPMAVLVSSDNVELDDKWIERDFVSQGRIRSHPRV
jgi:hypothetical protein